VPDAITNREKTYKKAKILFRQFSSGARFVRIAATKTSTIHTENSQTSAAKTSRPIEQ